MSHSFVSRIPPVTLSTKKKTPVTLQKKKKE
jgi:hypothetical protein